VRSELKNEKWEVLSVENFMVFLTMFKLSRRLERGGILEMIDHITCFNNFIEESELVDLP